MSNRDYLPAREAEFDQWVANFHARSGALASLGLSPADATELTAAVDLWTAEYATFQTARDAALAAATRKDGAKAALKAVVRVQVRRAQASPAITDATRAELRITIPPLVRTAIAAPTETPAVRLYFGDRGRIRVHFGPNPGNENANGLPYGVYGVVVECAGGGPPTSEEGWAHLATRTASPFLHAVESAAPTTFAYRCRYVNRRGDAGPWSAPAVGTVTP